MSGNLKIAIQKEIRDSLNGNVIMIVVIYKKLEDCLKRFFNDIPLEEVEELCGVDGQGREYGLSIPEMVEKINKVKCWGFCHQKGDLHLWVAPDCDMSELIHLLGHERGHLIRPFHRIAANEEKKAELFGQTAKFAYQIALQLKEEVKQCVTA